MRYHKSCMSYKGAYHYKKLEERKIYSFLSRIYSVSGDKYLLDFFMFIKSKINHIIFYKPESQ